MKDHGIYSCSSGDPTTIGADETTGSRPCQELHDDHRLKKRRRFDQVTSGNGGTTNSSYDSDTEQTMDEPAIEPYSEPNAAEALLLIHSSH